VPRPLDNAPRASRCSVPKSHPGLRFDQLWLSCNQTLSADSRWITTLRIAKDRSGGIELEFVPHATVRADVCVATVSVAIVRASFTTTTTKDRSANGTSASVGRAGRIMRSNRRSWLGRMRPDRGGAAELPIHAQGRICLVGSSPP
jgi:hypothetical protein